MDTQRIAKYTLSWRKIGTNLCIIILSAIVILADVPLMQLWLAVFFAAMLVVNAGPLEQTARKLIGR